jgi:hypothetical protein
MHMAHRIEAAALALLVGLALLLSGCGVNCYGGGSERAAGGVCQTAARF